MQYNSLHELINIDHEAREYFDTLPMYIQDQMGARSNSVNTLESLKECAKELLRYDD